MMMVVVVVVVMMMTTTILMYTTTEYIHFAVASSLRLQKRRGKTDFFL